MASNYAIDVKLWLKSGNQAEFRVWLTDDATYEDAEEGAKSFSKAFMGLDDNDREINWGIIRHIDNGFVCWRSENVELAQANAVELW